MPAHEFTYYCAICSGLNNTMGATPVTGIVRIKAESGVPVSPGFTHGEAVDNGTAINSDVDSFACKGLGKMLYSSSVVIMPPPQPPAPPAGWDVFCQRVDQGWQAFRNSGWDTTLRGINNRGTPQYVATAQPIRTYIRNNNGIIVISGGTYFSAESSTAGVSLKRTIPSSANVPPTIRAYIYHL
jgi:hypothetical protein